jgi:hypothetical protein
VDPLGEVVAASTSYSRVQVQQAGLDLGLTQTGMDGWCCYHEVFVQFPDFFEVLITHNQAGVHQGRAAAIGGLQVVLPGAIDLDPSDATNPAVSGTTHTVTATVRDSNLDPLQDESVDFAVLSGPNAGATGSDITDASGQASFTYASNGGEGTDVIQASFTDATGTLRTATAQKTWVKPPIQELCLDLIAGQHTVAGEVCIINDADTLFVTYTTNDGWVLNQTHLHFGNSLADFPLNRPGNPQIGHFAHSNSHSPGVTEFTYEAPLGDLDGEIVIGAYAAVSNADVGTSEAAWGNGQRFVDQGNWAMYFKYTIQ